MLVMFAAIPRPAHFPRDATVGQIKCMNFCTFGLGAADRGATGHDFIIRVGNEEKYVSAK